MRKFLPLVGCKNYSPIISFAPNDSSHTLSSLPKSIKCEEIIVSNLRYKLIDIVTKKEKKIQIKERKEFQKNTFSILNKMFNKKYPL